LSLTGGLLTPTLVGMEEPNTDTPSVPIKPIAVDHDATDVILYVGGQGQTIEGHIDPAHAVEIAALLLKHAGMADTAATTEALGQLPVGQMILLGVAAFRAGISLQSVEGGMALVRGPIPEGVTPPVEAAPPTAVEPEPPTKPDPFAGLDEIVARLDQK
jgi:hypothetical protein